MTIGRGERFFLLVVNDDHASILHGYGDTGLQKFCGHEFDLLGSSDVIGHVTIGLGVGTFLLVVNDDHDDDDDDEGRMNFSVALSSKTTRTRNNKLKQ